MNRKYYKLLHYVLIILLVFTPVRGVMSAQQAHCDPADMSMTESAMSMPASMPTAMQGHEMHRVSSADVPVDQMQTDQSAVNKQCCCCDSDCKSNCDIGVTASLVIQDTTYSPVFINTSNTINFNSEVLVRALTPPSRPPATLS